MSEYICSVCGSKYELSSSHVPVRDRGSISCEVCSKEIIKWNGSRIWSAKLVIRGKRPNETT